MTNNNNKGRRYTKEFKESILERLTMPTNETVASISAETNVPKGTIYQWIKDSKKNQESNPVNLKVKNHWTSEDKFHIVLETATFTEGELAEYCRRKGIYLEEIKEWKKQCISANTAHTEDPSKLKEISINDKKKIKELEKELRRKEKALAETAALLVLRKKAQAIWGDNEDE